MVLILHMISMWEFLSKYGINKSLCAQQIGNNKWLKGIKLEAGLLNFWTEPKCGLVEKA